MRQVLAKLDALLAEPESETTVQQPANNTSNKIDPAQLQAQAQLLGAMEDINSEPKATAPMDKEAEEALTEADLTQLHKDFDSATVADEKRDALVMLVKSDTTHAATILRDAYADTEPDVRKEAVLQMLAFNTQPAVIDLLIKALADPDPSVVIEAVEGLAHVTTRKAVAALKQIAKTHPDETVRLVAEDYVSHQ